METWLVAMNSKWCSQVIKVSDELAVAIWQSNTARESMLARSGGVGYSSMLVVYYKGRVLTREFAWRHRYHADLDRPDLYVKEIGKITETLDDDNNIAVNVQVINNEGTRTEKFVFPRA